MNQDTKRLLLCAQAIYETIIETNGAPSGHLYAGMMSLINLDEYNHIIASLKKADLIEESHYFITPKKKADKPKNSIVKKSAYVEPEQLVLPGVLDDTKQRD